MRSVEYNILYTYNFFFWEAEWSEGRFGFNVGFLFFLMAVLNFSSRTHIAFK